MINQCPRCKSKNSLIKTQEFNKYFLFCRICTRSFPYEPPPIPQPPNLKVVPKPPTPPIVLTKQQEEINQRPPRPQVRGKTAAQKAQERYRKTDLYRRTNRAIQARYRASRNGRQVYKDHNSKKSILRRMANRVTPVYDTNNPEHVNAPLGTLPVPESDLPN